MTFTVFPWLPTLAMQSSAIVPIIRAPLRCANTTRMSADMGRLSFPLVRHQIKSAQPGFPWSSAWPRFNPFTSTRTSSIVFKRCCLPLRQPSSSSSNISTSSPSPTLPFHRRHSTQLPPPKHPSSVSETVGETIQREEPAYDHPTIFAPILFSALVVVLSGAIAASIQEEHEYQQSKMLLQSLATKMSDVWWLWVGGKPDVDERGVMVSKRAERTPGGWKVGGIFDRYAPYQVKRFVTVMRSEWGRYGPSRQLVYQIVALNTLAFLAWQIRPLHPFMTRHFLHHPHSRRMHTMITAAFSHQSVMHFAFNMMALTSLGVGGPVYNLLETKEHWLAFYISAATLSSLGSHLFTVLGRRPALPSLGASGAIFSVFAGTAALCPETGVRIMFLPWRFELGDVLPALVMLDVIGLVSGWRFFDHAAHLSGVVFGYWYTLYGIEWYRTLLDDLRERRSRRKHS
ncbi:hypothetical protein SeMB42_g06252 [Synchytrium endobioticum]|uniref:Peptidase S54 rhomboid domain-containing protein n=1 Tax=Synchytrium endobioticum TaxID=286115 RepID=A0A507CMC4_9FUNG|nr:hypothetical protein SeMB42_g06252 [Synchytrium endobioticum]